MTDTPPDDPLDTTKMSFAAHLEELRLAIFKSLAALIVGTLVGLTFGWTVVDYIQKPIRDSLTTFYRNQAEQENLQQLRQQQSAGETVPEDLDATAKQMADEGLVPDEIYIDPRELAKLRNEPLPVDDPATTRDQMVKLKIYRALENDNRLTLISLSGQESFFVYVKASLVV